MTGFISWLDEPDVSPARAGGKAASLARLGAAGFPVPPGFAVTVEAYRLFHEALDLDAAMAALLEIDGRPAPSEVQRACEPLLGRLTMASIPAPVAEAVSSAYAELTRRAPPGFTVAVRSSGVTEDGAGASFAGLYESYLNLQGLDPVIGAIADCYRCLWSPRAVHYRAVKGFDHRREAMGVVVMQTVPSASAGVAFSLNPVTGATDEVLINSSWGLGEAVVSGFVTPDNFIAGKDGDVRRRDVFPKGVRVVSAPGGTRREETPAHIAAQPSLTDDQVALVARTVARVEDAYGCPVDVEFAFDPEGRFYLLQARPITTG
jgi:pyruvate,water dikinase